MIIATLTVKLMTMLLLGCLGNDQHQIQRNQQQELNYWDVLEAITTKVRVNNKNLNVNEVYVS
jgi:hypothetical protein